MNEYKKLKEAQQAEVNAFPFMFAFNNKQFAEGMRDRLGLDPSETDKIYSIGGGGYIRRSDAAALHEMTERHQAERDAAIKADTTGEGYIFQMFNYELANHEYSYTGDLSETLEALGLDLDTINASTALKHGLKKAISAQTDE